MCGNYGLTECDAAIVGWDKTVGEHNKSLLTEAIDA